MFEVLTENEVSVEKEMKRSYLDYAMSVIVGRALPDVRDGLKPVHRRVLFAMKGLNNFFNKPYKKSARVVGDVIGKYHPHGDSAVYSTIVRMAQNFSLRYPLIDGQGNFGSVDGDPPAAMRYTEVRMQALAHEMLEDIEKDTIEWVPNYDDSTKEPVVLPAKFPSLLVNGSSGIAVGMATNIPPHNLGEVIDGINHLIDHPNSNCDDIMKYIPGPDFPTAGTIYGSSMVKEAYKTGRGIIRIRANIVVERDENSGNEVLVVTEIPYQINKSKLVENIANLIKNKHIDGLRYIRDESDRNGMRIVMPVKKGQLSDVIVNQLYKHTQMEVSFGIIFLAVVNERPIVLTLKQVLEFFIQHRKIVVIKRVKFDLKVAEKRAHVLEGLKVALNSMNEVISMVRNSRSSVDAKARLIETLQLSSIQSQAILDMKLNRLTSLEQDKIISECNLVLEQIKSFKEILDDEKMVLAIIKAELNDLKKKFSDGRRTKIVSQAKKFAIEDIVAKEDMVITITGGGYIKRNPINLYQSQGRGGRGKMAMGIKNDDFVSHLFVASTHHYFLFFTNMGKTYWLKVYDIPMSGRQTRGKAIVNLLDFSEGEKMTAVLPVSEFDPSMYIVMATRNGLVKKSKLMEFSRPRSGGIIAIKLIDGDELVSVKLSTGGQEIFLGSSNGKSIRFKESDVRPTGRKTVGVRGMKLVDGSFIVGMEVLTSDYTIFVVTENGFGKRTATDGYPSQKRGGKGVITIKTNKRNGDVIGVVLVKNDDDLMLLTDSGKLIRMPVSSTKVISRNTQGVRLIMIDSDERVVSTVGLRNKEETLNFM